MIAWLNVKSNRRAALFFIALISLIRTWQGGANLTDSFHNGEYFVSAINYMYKGTPPLMIHGLLDIFPAMLSRLIAGESYYLYTWFAYKLLGGVSVFLIIYIGLSLRQDTVLSWLLVVLLAVVAVDAVGYRDLFLLLTFLAILLNDRKRSLLVYFICGVVAAIGVFWSFDRGAAGFSLIGVLFLRGLAGDKRMMAPLGGWLIAMVGLTGSSSLFHISNYLENFLFLLETSSLWRLPFDLNVLFLVTYTAFFNLFIFYLYFKHRKMDEGATLLVAFFVLMIFMMKVAFNRADTGHVSWAFWVPMLMCIQLTNKKLLTTVKINITMLGLSCVGILLGMTLGWMVGVVSSLALIILWKKSRVSAKNADIFSLKMSVVPVLFVCVLLGKGVLKGQFSWVGLMMDPPQNKAVVPHRVAWVADRLEDVGVNCVFDMTNSGTINGLINRPTCYRFSYPIYASANYEVELMNDLESSKPRVIVYSLDGATLKSRFPKLYEFIEFRYPKQVCHEGYCLRYL